MAGWEAEDAQKVGLELDRNPQWKMAAVRSRLTFKLTETKKSQQDNKTMCF